MNAMKPNTDRIQVTHVGSLSRPDSLLEANRRRPVAADGLRYEPSVEFDAALAGAVDDVVADQLAAGLTWVNDGEFGKAMTSELNFGAWWAYSFNRVEGLQLFAPEESSQKPVHSEPGHIRLTTFGDRRDWVTFKDFYASPGSSFSSAVTRVARPETVAPLKYAGYVQVAADVDNLKAAMAAHGVTDGFITSISPASAARVGNRYYATEEEHVWAWAEVMREEYLAITRAGLTVQIDDPFLAESWDQINPEPELDEYLAFLTPRVQALNWALRDIPEDQIRYHLCWGSWHGPHTTDIPMADIVGTMLQVNAGAYSFEAANARHEHEWKVWQDVTLPEGKVILPGVVGHATNVVEHPDLVAERIARFASVVGRERVIASTDCGLGGRVHPQIAAAKLQALGEGARRASAALF